MRSRAFLACLISALAFLGLSATAHAGIPIPCTSEKIVLVKPFTQAGLEKGESVGLGYLYQGCFSGKWITHTGSDSQYRGGGEILVELVKKGSGEKLSEPSLFWGMRNAPGKFWVEWLWFAIIGIFGAAFVSNKIRYGSFVHPSAQAADQAHSQAPSASTSGSPQPRRPMAGGFGKRA